MKEEPQSLMEIAEHDILDKSKSNAIVKALALIQIFWFAVQIIARLTQSRQVALLEIVTFVHGIFALLTFILWWSKPFDVSTPTPISPRTSVPQDLVTDEAAMAFLDISTSVDLFFSDKIRMSCIKAILNITYGALHFLAINAEFPSLLESHLWLASIIVILTVNFGAPLCLIVGNLIPEDSAYPIFGGMLFSLSIVVCTLAELVARLFLIVESVRSLRFLPHAVYILPTWSTYIPHFG